MVAEGDRLERPHIYLILLVSVAGFFEGHDFIILNPILPFLQRGSGRPPRPGPGRPRFFMTTYLTICGTCTAVSLMGIFAELCVATVLFFLPETQRRELKETSEEAEAGAASPRLTGFSIVSAVFGGYWPRKPALVRAKSMRFFALTGVRWP